MMILNRITIYRADNLLFLSNRFIMIQSLSAQLALAFFLPLSEKSSHATARGVTDRL